MKVKLTNRGRIVIGVIFTMTFLAINGVVGLPPAFTPTKAEALIAQQQESKKVLLRYANADSLSDLQLVELLKAVGFKGKALREAWAVAKKESNGHPLSHNGNRKTGDNSYGLFQINMLGEMGAERRAKFGLGSNAELLNPVVNAKVAYHMSNGGKNWSAWKGVSIKKLKQFPQA